MGRCLLIIGFCVVLLSISDVKAQDIFTNSILIYSTENNQATTTGTTDTLYAVKDIYITGTKRTRNPTILRELSFKTGDAYPLPQIIEKLEQAKRQLINTNLLQINIFHRYHN